MSFANDLRAGIYVSNQTGDFSSDKIVREFIRGETAYCAFLAKGFTRDNKGRVNLSADIKFTYPSGEIIKRRNFARSKKFIPQEQEGMAVVLNNGLDIIFDKDDFLGMYTLEVTVKDKLARTEDKTYTTLLLFNSQEEKNIIMSSVKDGKDLDDLWAQYFKTKNPLAIKRIISALYMREKYSDVETFATGAAAMWSLQVNARDHSDVYKICKEEVRKTKGVINEMLQEILAFAENKE